GRQSSALQPGVDLSTDSLGTVLSPTSATIVESNRHADEQFHLVARIQIHPGALFEIYEPAPGFIAYSGAGSAEGALQDVTAVSLRGKSLADVWELVSIEPMPTDVAAAAERQLARWAEAGVDPTSSVA